MDAVERDGWVGSSAEAADGAVRLAGFLIERGLVAPSDVERTRVLARGTGEPWHHALVRLGLLGEIELAHALSACLGLPLVRTADFPVLPIAHPALRPRFLEAHRALPLALDAASLVLAVADPLDGYAARSLALATGKPVEVKVGVPAELDVALKELAGGSAEGLTATTAAPGEDDVARLRDLAGEAPIVRLVDRLLLRAAEARASDIHLEPQGAALQVRYRIDGMLAPVEPPPPHLRAAVVSRLKIMAGLDIAERRLPQDGRIRFPVQGRAIDLRVSTIPFQHGEGMVLRLLDKGALRFQLEELGFAESNIARFHRMVAEPNGIVLVTGPTGSGKTSTLYTALLERGRPETKLVTVEDPIEYELAGVNQIQVKPGIGLTFAHALRAILRHDPDIIMVGEIRDLETAQIAVQAALTGHLVLSTLHTNGAAATVTRLLEMGLEDYLLAATINGVVAQRLVRRLCPHCREPRRPPPGLVERLAGSGIDAKLADGLYGARGCERCRSGYAGRIALAEVLLQSEAIRTAVLRRVSAPEIEGIATREGMRTLLQDGIDKAVAGLTSLEEVLMVARSA